MLHEPLNEIGREDVLREVVAWLSDRLDRLKMNVNGSPVTQDAP